MSMIEQEMKIDLNLDELLKAAGGAGNQPDAYQTALHEKVRILNNYLYYLYAKYGCPDSGVDYLMAIINAEEKARAGRADDVRVSSGDSIRYVYYNEASA